MPILSNVGTRSLCTGVLASLQSGQGWARLLCFVALGLSDLRSAYVPSILSECVHFNRDCTGVSAGTFSCNGFSRIV